jgi:hypothetical protein
VLEAERTHGAPELARQIGRRGVAQELAVVIDALGVRLWAHHMLHGSRAVSPDLFSRAVGLIVDGVIARSGSIAKAGGPI